MKIKNTAVIEISSRVRIKKCSRNLELIQGIKDTISRSIQSPTKGTKWLTQAFFILKLEYQMHYH